MAKGDVRSANSFFCIAASRKFYRFEAQLGDGLPGLVKADCRQRCRVDWSASPTTR